MPSMRELAGWYTTGQAAHRLGYSRQGVIDLAREGKVRAVYVGGEHEYGRGTWIYDPESVEAFTPPRRRNRVDEEGWEDVDAVMNRG